MSSTDDRIVKMQFDNAQFKRGAAETQKSLNDLNKTVESTGKGKGLLDLSNHMDTVKIKASAMSVAVGASIATMATRVTNASINMVKSLTFSPIQQGFEEYELKLKSIQTILSNTKGENLQSVTVALDTLNAYSDKTIYNFANMTQNIGKLTTAGVGLKDATNVVKGFHNMVALAGGDATAAAGAMEQFVYGLQAGKITALDWQSIATRGLGSAQLQKAFFETARAAGTLKDVPLSKTFDEWQKDVGGFKGSLESGWLTADVATKALSIMTGDVKSVQELMKQGFSEKAAKDLLATAASAVESATKVRTLTAFMGTLREQLASGWAKIMEAIFGDFNEATKLFTSLSDASGKALGAFFGYVGSLFETWNKMGGRLKVLEGFKNLLAPIGALIKVIGNAWKAAFPSKGAGTILYTLSAGFAALTKPLQWLAAAIETATHPLAFLFRLMHIGISAVKAGGRAIGDFIQKLIGLVDIDVSGAGGGFLDFIKKLAREIGSAVKKVDDLIRKGKSITEAFGSINIKMPKLPNLPSMPKLPGLPDITGIFSSAEKSSPKIVQLGMSVKSLAGNMQDLSGAAEKVTDSDFFNPKARIDGSQVIDRTRGEVGGLVTELTKSQSTFETVGDKMGGILSALKDRFIGFLKNFSFDDLVSSFNLAVLSTFMISISRFFNTLTNSFKGFVGTGEAINGILENAGTALKSFQTAARAKLIMAIAVAVGILAASLWLLSKIPVKDLAPALIAMGVTFVFMTRTLGAMTKMIEKLDGKGISVRLVALGFALTGLGLGLLLLAGAFKILSTIGWKDALKNLITFGFIMKTLGEIGKLGEGSGKTMLSASVSIGLIALAMTALAVSLLLFKLVDWESMAKAGASLAGLTAAVGILALIPYQGIAKVGVAMLSVSVGMLALANALVIFGFVKWESIAKAGVMLLALTASLAALMLVANPLTISGVVGLSAAMIGLALAGLILNKVDWSSIVKIGAIMGILTLAFGGFLLVMTIFTPVLIVLSAFAGSIALLALALTGLALAFAIIGPLLAGGTAMFAAFATGAAVAIGVFLQSLALQAPIMKTSFLKILKTLIDTIVEAVPMVIDGVKRLFAAIKKELTEPKKATLVGDAGKSWMEKLRDKIKEKIPELVEKAKELVKSFLKGLAEHAGEFGKWGATLVVNLLHGIATKAKDIADAAADLIIALAQGLQQNLNKLINAGFVLISDFLHRLADTIRNKSGAIGEGILDVVDAMKDVGVNMVKGLIKGLGSMVKDAMKAVGGLVGGLVKHAKNLLDEHSPSRVFAKIGQFIVLGLAGGITAHANLAVKAITDLVGTQIAAANSLLTPWVQRIDANARSARGRAEGLALAAEKAAKAAAKTKTKADDKKAEALQTKADKAATKADRLEARAEKAQERADRNEAFKKASTLEQAQMKSEDAQQSLQDAKDAAEEAKKDRTAAAALRAQAKTKGLNKNQRNALLKQAKELDAAAAKAEEAADKAVNAARTQASQALNLQNKAGAEAAAEFERIFKAEAQADADAAAFDKMSLEDKVAKRKEQARILQAQAEKDLTEAKTLAYTDMESANELAQTAIEEAEQARQFLLDADQYQQQIAQAAEEAARGAGTPGTLGTTEIGGTVVNLDPSAAAAIAFNQYSDLYAASTAAAAMAPTVEFKQYNTSPEALSPTEVYRQTNNLLTYAADKLQPSAA